MSIITFYRLLYSNNNKSLTDDLCMFFVLNGFSFIWNLCWEINYNFTVNLYEFEIEIIFVDHRNIIEWRFVSHWLNREMDDGFFHVVGFSWIYEDFLVNLIEDSRKRTRKKWKLLRPYWWRRLVLEKFEHMMEAPGTFWKWGKIYGGDAWYFEFQWRGLVFFESQRKKSVEAPGNSRNQKIQEKFLKLNQNISTSIIQSSRDQIQRVMYQVKQRQVD